MGQVTKLETRVIDEDGFPCEDVVAEPVGDRMDEDLDHVITVLDGYDQLLTKDEVDYAGLTGTESYAMTVLKLRGFAGNESWIDTVKKTAEAAYKSIIDILKGIQDYFFGEGKKQIEEADKKVTEDLKALSGTDLNKPVNDGPATEPGNYVKDQKDNTIFQKLMDDHPSIKNAVNKVTSSASRVANANTVGQMGAVYQDMRKSTSAALEEVSRVLTKAIAETRKQAEAMRKPKDVPDTEDPEVKQAAKQEHQAVVASAKEGTKEVRAIANIRNQLLSTLRKIGAHASTLSTSKVESGFKG